MYIQEYLYIRIAEKYYHFITRKGETMKPVYDPSFMRWKVKGLGWFNSRKEAREAIRKQGYETTLLLRLTSKMKQDLETLAYERDITVSELIRQMIMKEVNGNG